MKYKIFLIFLTVLFIASCNKGGDQTSSDDLKKKELEQKEKELEQLEKELDSLSKTNNESLSEDEYLENTKTDYYMDGSKPDNPHYINEALERLCTAINKSDKQALKEFSGLSPAEILEGFTNEFEETAKPECTKKNNLKSEFNYIKSDTQYYMYAMEYGDGYGALLMSFENGKWIAKQFIHGEDLKKIKKQKK